MNRKYQSIAEDVIVQDAFFMYHDEYMDEYEVYSRIQDEYPEFVEECEQEILVQHDDLTVFEVVPKMFEKLSPLIAEDVAERELYTRGY